MAAAAALLAVLGWAILKYSVRLPIGPFFAATASLLALLAFVFVGHGVAALQEAGVLTFTPVRIVAVPLLGIQPSAGPGRPRRRAACRAALLYLGHAEPPRSEQISEAMIVRTSAPMREGALAQ